MASGANRQRPLVRPFVQAICGRMFSVAGCEMNARYLVNGHENDLGHSIAVEITSGQDRMYVTSATGTQSALAIRIGDKELVSYKGRQYVIEKPSRQRQSHAIASGLVCAPMPGQIVEVCCAVGDTVSTGQRLLVLEAMKMQQSILSPFSGVVTELEIALGSQVVEGQTLVTLEATA